MLELGKVFSVRGWIAQPGHGKSWSMACEARDSIEDGVVVVHDPVGDFPLREVGVPAAQIRRFRTAAAAIADVRSSVTAACWRGIRVVEGDGGDITPGRRTRRKSGADVLVDGVMAAPPHPPGLLVDGEDGAKKWITDPGIIRAMRDEDPSLVPRARPWHLILDEIAHWSASDSGGAAPDLIRRFMGTIRHYHCRFDWGNQNPIGVHSRIRDLSTELFIGRFDGAKDLDCLARVGAITVEQVIKIQSLQKRQFVYVARGGDAPPPAEPYIPPEMKKQFESLRRGGGAQIKAAYRQTSMLGDDK